MLRWQSGRLRGKRKLNKSPRSLNTQSSELTESKENVEHLDLDVAEILVRKIPDDQQLIDLRLCVLVSADVGKSTLLGVLTPQGELDNGRAARGSTAQHVPVP